VKAFYHDQFVFPLPEGHRFPISKYALLRERVLAEQIIDPADLKVPEPASDEQILRVHTPEYLSKVKSGTLSPREIRRIGFPWSPQLVERSRRSVGGTIAASQVALFEGIAVNLAGGTHHAYPDHGEGFCVFNDVAIAARAMQVERGINPIVILDCDVHQGNGTALVFKGDPTVFTFSIHGAKNFPFHKEESDLDLALEDGTSDEAYLEALHIGVRKALSATPAKLAIFLSGADAYLDDRLGRLALTKAGLIERDRIVYEACWKKGIPLTVVMAGGYGRNVKDTVDIHFNTVKAATVVAKNFNGRIKTNS
jgi:acetoin utilization deacetylase AcuC-like enzyme